MVKIADLPLGNAVSNSDVLPIDQNGLTRQVTVAQLGLTASGQALISNFEAVTPIPAAQFFEDKLNIESYYKSSTDTLGDMGPAIARAINDCNRITASSESDLLNRQPCVWIPADQYLIGSTVLTSSEFGGMMPALNGPGSICGVGQYRSSLRIQPGVDIGAVVTVYGDPAAQIAFNATPSRGAIPQPWPIATRIEGFAITGDNSSLVAQDGIRFTGNFRFVFHDDMAYEHLSGQAVQLGYLDTVRFPSLTASAMQESIMGRARIRFCGNGTDCCTLAGYGSGLGLDHVRFDFWRVYAPFGRIAVRGIAGGRVHQLDGTFHVEGVDVNDGSVPTNFNLFEIGNAADTNNGGVFSYRFDLVLTNSHPGYAALVIDSDNIHDEGYSANIRVSFEGAATGQGTALDVRSGIATQIDVLSMVSGTTQPPGDGYTNPALDYDVKIGANVGGSLVVNGFGAENSWAWYFDPANNAGVGVPFLHQTKMPVTQAIEATNGGIFGLNGLSSGARIRAYAPQATQVPITLAATTAAGTSDRWGLMRLADAETAPIVTTTTATVTANNTLPVASTAGIVANQLMTAGGPGIGGPNMVTGVNPGALTVTLFNPVNVAADSTIMFYTNTGSSVALVSYDDSGSEFAFPVEFGFSAIRNGPMTIPNLIANSGTIQSGVTYATAGANNGLATLDNTGKLLSSQLPASVAGALNYQGVWNASTNTPALASGTGTKGYYYVVSVAGTTNLDGNSSWAVNDTAAFNGTVWNHIAGTAGSVSQVVGQTGTVTASQIYTALEGTATGTFPDAGTINTALGTLFPRSGGTLYGALHMGTQTIDGSNVAFTGGAISGVDATGALVVNNNAPTKVNIGTIVKGELRLDMFRTGSDVSGDYSKAFNRAITEAVNEANGGAGVNNPRLGNKTKILLPCGAITYGTDWGAPLPDMVGPIVLHGHGSELSAVEISPNVVTGAAGLFTWVGLYGGSDLAIGSTPLVNPAIDSTARGITFIGNHASTVQLNVLGQVGYHRFMNLWDLKFLSIPGQPVRFGGLPSYYGVGGGSGYNLQVSGFHEVIMHYVRCNDSGSGGFTGSSPGSCMTMMSVGTSSDELRIHGLRIFSARGNGLEIYASNVVTTAPTPGCTATATVPITGSTASIIVGANITGTGVTTGAQVGSVGSSSITVLNASGTAAAPQTLGAVTLTFTSGASYQSITGLADNVIEGRQPGGATLPGGVAPYIGTSLQLGSPTNASVTTATLNIDYLNASPGYAAVTSYAVGSSVKLSGNFYSTAGNVGDVYLVKGGGIGLDFKRWGSPSSGGYNVRYGTGTSLATIDDHGYTLGSILAGGSGLVFQYDSGYSGNTLRPVYEQVSNPNNPPVYFANGTPTNTTGGAGSPNPLVLPNALKAGAFYNTAFGAAITTAVTLTANRRYAALFYVGNADGITLETLSVILFASFTGTVNIEMCVYGLLSGTDKPGALIAGSDTGTQTLTNPSAAALTYSCGTPPTLAQGFYYLSLFCDSTLNVTGIGAATLSLIGGFLEGSPTAASAGTPSAACNGYYQAGSATPPSTFGTATPATAVSVPLLIAGF